MRKLTPVVFAAAALFAGCAQSVPPQVLQEYQSRTLFTCCNIYYESDQISDADYHVGTVLPFGTPVHIESMTSKSVTFTANGTKLTLTHSYGVNQESAQQYFDKVLVANDPKTVVAGYPEQVRNAIRDARVEVGMTPPQVITSLGYPPTHQTASTSATEWTYWYNRWVTFKVFFDGGVVSRFMGTNVPTSNQPIIAPTPVKAPPAKAAPARKKR